MAQKRERCINFTREEVEILIEMVEAKKHIIENKKSDAVTWRQKEQCWKDIEVSFNAASGSTHRSSKNLRLKYESIKRDTRKKSALIRAETYRTGGGPSTAPTLTPIEIKVKQMILLSVDGMESNYDSDNNIPIPNSEVMLLENQVPPYDPNDNNCSNGHQLEVYDDNVDETLVPPVKITLVDTEDTADLEKPDTEIGTKWSQWKPTSLRLRKHPALCNPKLKRPFEKVADAKMEMIDRQNQILEEEYKNKKLQWAYEEEERNHKRELWVLEKKIVMQKLYMNE